ncbi:MAG: hypothetical protein BJG00_012145 [Limnothrix sp. CACIAM 69d]|nr:MAG: hypothetical protein BJG00_012145 [Limnothrix sp. CACIAM 69d]
MQRKRVRWWRGFAQAIESGAESMVYKAVHTDWAIAPLKNRLSTGQSTTQHPIKQRLSTQSVPNQH